jgi:hydrogenase maturation protease
MAPSPECQVLVAGIGNVFRSDDGFGSEVARRLTRLPWPDGVRVVDYGIGGLHLAYDLLDDWDVLVLVDAVPDRGGVGSVAVLAIGPDDVRAEAPLDAHGMDPATVLAALARLGGHLPPRTFLVACQIAETGDGMGLSPAVEDAVDPAVRMVRELVGAVAMRPAEVS